MGRISSDVGLISGINITETVDKLIQLQSAPKLAAEKRQQAVADKQKALTELTALAIGVQLSIRRLNTSDAFTKRAVTSANAAILTGTATNSVPTGSYSVTAARIAQAHQVATGGLASRTSALGAGTFSVSFGGFVDQSKSLADLNGGAGVTRGFIKITDRSGATAQVDLRAAQSIDDVLAAINGASGISVKASTVGDSIRIADLTGESTSNLRVQEVGSGKTAADLGLAGINVAASSATGNDIQELFTGLRLDALNDGNGLSIREGVADLEVSFRDNSSPLNITFENSATIGDVLNTLNAADPTRLSASISGNRLVLTDLTADGGGTFEVASTAGGTLAQDLGLEGTASGGTLTGDNLLGGLKTSLLRSLGGGNGIGTLGSIEITNRSGAPATIVNLSSASTLDDVIQSINDANAGVTASYNSARNGLVIEDTSGGTGNLVIANGDSNNAATKLNLAVNAAVGSVDSGSLKRQSISENTKLSSLNGGSGVNLSTILVTNANGDSKALALGTLAPQTIGDVIDAINALGNGVTASINADGDGIALVDTTGGPGTLTVGDLNGGTAAKDLHLAGVATGTTISGSTAFSISVAAEDTLEDLARKINELGGPFTASIVSDGDGSLPHRLELTSKSTGKAAALQVQTNLAGFNFSEVTAAQDTAILLNATSTSAGRLITSSTTKLSGVVDGLDVTILQASTNPVTLNVAQNTTSVTAAIQLFVDQYNKLREKVDTLDFYSTTDNTKGLLFGSVETLRLNSDLGNLITGRQVGVGRFQTLSQMGVTIDDTGKLEFNSLTLTDRLNSTDGDDVIKFFSDTERGFAKVMDDKLETLIGRDNSLFITRLNVLATQSDQNTARIKFLQERLDASRLKLLNQFYRMELAIGRIQASQSSLTTLQNLATTLQNG